LKNVCIRKILSKLKIIPNKLKIKKNREDLERVQKAALKLILKEDHSNYKDKDALKHTKMKSLHER